MEAGTDTSYIRAFIWVASAALINSVLNSTNTAVMIRHFDSGEVSEILTVLLLWSILGTMFLGLQPFVISTSKHNSSVSQQRDHPTRNGQFRDAAIMCGFLLAVVSAFRLVFDLSWVVVAATALFIPMMIGSLISDGLLISQDSLATVQVSSIASSGARICFVFLCSVLDWTTSALLLLMPIAFSPSIIACLAIRRLKFTAIPRLSLANLLQFSFPIAAGFIMVGSDVLMARLTTMQTTGIYSIQLAAVTRALPFMFFVLGLSNAARIDPPNLNFSIRRLRVPIALIVLAAISGLSPLGAVVLRNLFAVPEWQIQDRSTILLAHCAWSVFMFFLPTVALRPNGRIQIALIVGSATTMGLLLSASNWNRFQNYYLAAAISSGFAAMIHSVSDGRKRLAPKPTVM